MTKKFGFTLAEVLITLGIIGVVAAMTIPTLMNQTGVVEFKTGCKKAVSVLNQAITMNVALEGNDFSALTTGQAQGSVYYMFKNRINVVRDTTGKEPNLGTTGAAPFNQTGNYTMYLNDGMAITFSQSATSCTTASLGAATPTAYCRVVVDVNGVKKPNKLSAATYATTTAGVYDQFVLDFYNQQVQPHDEKAKYVLYN